MQLVFTHPLYLWFLLALPILIFTHFFTLRQSRAHALKFANYEAITRVTEGYILSKPFVSMFRGKNLILLAMRIITLICLTLAVSGTTVFYEGTSTDYDFVIAIDASSSMLAEDFLPTRLEAAKNAAALFVDSLGLRPNVGVVSFAGAAFVEQKLTNRMLEVKQAISSIGIKTVGGTDLGSAIITSTNLFASAGRPKAIILLTDGQSNVGVAPERGIDYANDNGVAVHTIGIGTEQGSQIAGLNITTTIDEETLQLIAKNTGGNYYRVKDEASLINAYKEIADLKKQKISLELAFPLLLAALLILFMEWSLVNTRYRVIT